MRTGILSATFCAVIIASAAPPGFAQTIRVTSLEAAVRARPDPAAEILALVKAGTLFDVVARQEKWYEVRLPASGGTPERRGFVLADVVEPLPVRGAPPPPAPAGLTAAGSAAGARPLPADWQARRDRALADTGSGKSKIRISIPITLVGLGIAMYAGYGSLFTDQKMEPDEWAMLGGGGALTAVGFTLMARGRSQVARATRELLILEDEKQRARDFPAILTFGSEAARVDVILGGRRIAAMMHVGW
jgi:hypothetical protein